jgi:hypothetical protein
MIQNFFFYSFTNTVFTFAGDFCEGMILCTQCLSYNKPFHILIILFSFSEIGLVLVLLHDIQIHGFK